MQRPSFRKVKHPISISGKIWLLPAAAITTLLLLIFFSAGTPSVSATNTTTLTTCPVDIIQNGDFEFPGETPGAVPLGWSTGQWLTASKFVREPSTFHSGANSVRITSANANDAWLWQQVTVEPNTIYAFSGWIKTENVASGVGANLSLVGTWSHSEGIFGTQPWTRVTMMINTGSSTQLTIGARLGYWGGTSSGTAWFDDLRLTPVRTDGSHPRWKILVLIYDKTDLYTTDSSGVRHHLVGAMTPAEIDRATIEATKFVQTDIPALTNGNMIPELTIRYPDHPLKPPEWGTQGWSPTPADTAADRDPAFDSVIVIWDPRVVDEDTGTRHWIGAAAGLATAMGREQLYTAIIIEATGYGHRNVFKHEWGHCILFYFDAMGTAPKPAVTNHANINQYVHWPTGENYVWLDESDANPIPNSIYNNESGFTHDYYSGTTATADEPARRLGIPPEAWALGGPVSKPGELSSPPEVFTCGGYVTVTAEPGTCWARVSVAPPTGPDGCDINASLTATRSDGLPIDAPYSCGQTLITWSSPNSEASCQQVVTVSDEAPPYFIHFPPSLNVSTGPDATSCGTVVDDAQLRPTIPATDPVFQDEIRPPSSSRLNDIASAVATADSETLTFTVKLTEQVFLASSINPRSLTGYIDIDTDGNAATGVPSSVDVSPIRLNLGVEFQIDLGSEFAHPGMVDVRLRQGGPVVVGKVPILVNGTSFTIPVPLTLLGNDNGIVRYAVSVGVVGLGQTDTAPNGGIPLFSFANPELMVRDDCAGVIVNRTGVPANNLFPTGETLVTYTATDASGNLATWTQKVTVADNTPPVISGAAVNPATLWPPNREMVDVTVNYDAADNCGMLETTLSVTSNEPVTADARPAWQVVDAHHVRLRAQRSARAGDRIYTITITAKDIHGNVAHKSVEVTVPQNGKGLRTQ